MYTAIFVPIEKTTPIKGADRIVEAEFLGYRTIVSADTKEGDLGIFFPSDGQLSHELCMEARLYHTNPLTLQPMGGYLEKNVASET